MSNIDESAITIFCPCWGEQHLDYLRRFALPSVMQAGNLPACGYSKIIIRGSVIGADNIEPLAKILREGFQGFPAEFYVDIHPNRDSALLQGLRNTIRFCIESKSRMLLLMPDTIISNGGILNMREYARNKRVSVAAPHLRVLEAPLIASDPRIPEGTLPILSPQALVRYAMANPHYSITNAYCDKDSDTLRTGVSLTRISDRLTTIIHYLPTVYLAWFEQSDLDFFNRSPNFGDWDHKWDAHLEREGRLRVFGTSELFFAVELTPDTPPMPVFPDTRFEEHSHEGILPLKSFVGALIG